MKDDQLPLAPGVYFDLSENVYHSDPFEHISLSSSVGKTLLAQSPLHAWTGHPRLNPAWEPSDPRKFDLAKAAHALMLNDRPERIAVIDFDDYRKNAAQAARDEAIANGQLPMLLEQYERVMAMVQAGREQLVQSADGRAFLDSAALSEVTLGWLDRGAMCRARIDRLAADHSIIFDYKTTKASAHPDGFGRVATSMQYRFQMQFYRRGYAACFPDRPTPQWRWIVQEDYPPYGLSIIAPDEAGEMIADQDVELALAIWRECMQSGQWPGYPPVTAVLETPVWEQTRFEHVKQSLGYRDARDTQAIRDRLFKWYAPIKDGV